jgi:nucleoside-diphosphate-sugar epimerase
MTATASSTVLITGGGGFIGRCLAQYLRQRGFAVATTARTASAARALASETGADARAVDLSDAVTVTALVQELAPEYVLNLACGRGEATPEQRRAVLDSTVLTTMAVVEAAAAADVRRLVHLGSATEYGPSTEPLAESRAPAPTTFFGAAKAAATLLCLQAAAADRLAAVVLRPFVVYGPGDRPNRLIPRAIASAQRGADLPLTVPGLRRDWVYVDDLGAACAAAFGGGADGEVVNVATGVQHANEEVVDLVERATGRPIARRVGEEPPRPWDAEHWVADVTKAKRLLGWAAATPLEKGIELTVAAQPAPAETAG